MAKTKHNAYDIKQKLTPANENSKQINTAATIWKGR